MDHVRALKQIANVEIGYLADIDDDRLAKAQKTAFADADRPPKTVKDFRRILDDKAIDALFIAAPNHWHAPATIMACNAGKHGYVEKPCSQHPWAGEMMVKAARKNKRFEQMGNQRQSWQGVIEGI
jgi:predicted dehydrogenase